MKKSLLIILFIFCFLRVVNAQDWSPFDLKERFNYHHDTTTLISANFFVDSVNVVNGDSLFYLNRIFNSIKNQTQFWQETMIKKSNGDYLFNNPGNLLLKTFAVLNDSWLFDSIKNISATISGIAIRYVFSTNDSVKILSLTSGDTIILSKHFGLIQFPASYADSSKLTLTGIEGRNLGELMPNFQTIFGFNINDIFVNETIDCNGCCPEQNYGSTVWSKILEKQYLPDSGYRYKALYNEVYLQPYLCGVNGGPVDYTIKGRDTNYIYNISNYSWLVRPACNSFVDFTEFAGIPTAAILSSVINYNGRKMIYVYTQLLIPVGNNCITCADTFTFSYPTTNFRLAEGIGLVTDDLGGFEGSYNNDLICYGNTDTSNNQCGDVYYAGIVENYLSPVSIFPNPSNGNFVMETKTTRQQLLQVFDITGKLMLTQTIVNNKTTIDASSLSNGIYSARLIGNNEVVNTKLVIVK